MSRTTTSHNRQKLDPHSRAHCDHHETTLANERNLVASEIIAAYIGIGVNALGLAFVASQVGLARRQLRHAQETNVDEIRRVKRQATMEYFMTTAEQRDRLAADLPSNQDLDAINRYIDAAFSEPDGTKRKRLRDYFSFYEAMAVAVAAGVYDLAVLDAMDGGTVLSITKKTTGPTSIASEAPCSRRRGSWNSNG
jgi:hypothetical protein